METERITRKRNRKKKFLDKFEERFIRIWRWIVDRCMKPNRHEYIHYGWRWIKCLWWNYQDFKNDLYNEYVVLSEEIWEENVSLERIDVDWNYCKENCKWIDFKEQAKNTRRTIWVYFDWERQRLEDLAKEYWIKPWLARNRYHRLWHIEEILWIKKHTQWVSEEFRKTDLYKKRQENLKQYYINSRIRQWWTYEYATILPRNLKRFSIENQKKIIIEKGLPILEDVLLKINS